jgi:hypothetical protein
MTYSVMTYSVMAWSVMAWSVMAWSVMAWSVMAWSVATPFGTLNLCCLQEGLHSKSLIMTEIRNLNF